MSGQQFGAKEFIIGATVGGLIGTLGALLLTPKKGNRLKRELADFYDSLSDKSHDFAGRFAKQGSCFARNFKDHACDWTDRAKAVLGQVQEGGIGSGHSRVFVIGALAGGALGAAAALLMAPKAGDEFRDDILDKYEDFSDRTQGFAKNLNKKGRIFAKTARSKTHRWLDLAKEVVDEFLDNGEDLTDHLSEKVKDYTEAGHDRLSDALEWASVGIKLWNTISKRR